VSRWWIGTIIDWLDLEVGDFQSSSCRSYAISAPVFTVCFFYVDRLCEKVTGFEVVLFSALIGVEDE